MYIFYLVLFITWSNCSLLSRFRYWNEYAAPPESTLLPKDLPDDLYENLIDERPELAPILGSLRKTIGRRPILGPSRKTIVRRPKMPTTRDKIVATSVPCVS